MKRGDAIEMIGIIALLKGRVFLFISLLTVLTPTAGCSNEAKQPQEGSTNVESDAGQVESAGPVAAGDVLPFPAPPPPRSSSGSTAKKRPPAPSSAPSPAPSPHRRRSTWG